MRIDEEHLHRLRKYALQHPLDGQNPPAVAVMLELPMQRVAQVILCTERRAGARWETGAMSSAFDGHSTTRWWNAAATVRSAEYPQGGYLDCEQAARVACERAMDGVGYPLSAWSWDKVNFVGRLRAELTDQEASTMALSPELPAEYDPGETWYLRDLSTP